MLSSLIVAAALAQDPTETDEPESESSTGAEEPPPAPEATTIAPKKRNFLMEVNFRGRYLALPESVLDIWYYKNAGEAFERPTVNAYALGIEWVIKDKQANGIFYVEYVVPTMKEGYWDDVESDADHTDGSWIKPDKFGIVTVGANYGYELHATNWFSFMFGAGLGVGFKTGQLEEWQSGETGECGESAPAYERRESCDPTQLELPVAIPFIDINLGPRFNISDRASIRLEGGLHNLPYGGAAVGIVF